MKSVKSWSRLFILCSIFVRTETVQADSCDQIKIEIDRTSELLKLNPLSPINCVFTSQNSAPQVQATNRLDKNVLRLEEIYFKALGIIPETFAYASCAEQNPKSNPIISYNYKQRSLIIPSDQKEKFAVLAHEIVHAIQDQNFSLDKIRKEASLTTDSALALDAVIEGQAVAIEHQIESFIDPVQQTPSKLAQLAPDNGPDCTPPEIFVAQSDLTYFLGPLFINSLNQNFQLNHWLNSPPLTTAEVIHPKLYPIKREQLATLPHGKNIKLSDRLGEFMIRSYLKLWLAAPIAAQAASGWQDDTIVIRTTQSEKLNLQWRTKWASAKDRDEFWRAIVAVFELRANIKLQNISDDISATPNAFPPFRLQRFENFVKINIDLN